MCYQKMGETRLAAMIKPALDIAQGRADQTVQSSCFCAGQTAE
jgi:hypothetical protein